MTKGGPGNLIAPEPLSDGTVFPFWKLTGWLVPVLEIGAQVPGAGPAPRPFLYRNRFFAAWVRI